MRREALLAWLCALRHHWPTSFARLTGDTGQSLFEELAHDTADPNRHLKLRRIAIANLAHLL